MLAHTSIQIEPQTHRKFKAKVALEGKGIGEVLRGLEAAYTDDRIFTVSGQFKEAIQDAVQSGRYSSVKGFIEASIRDKLRELGFLP